MKKTIAILLCVLLAITTLAGCSGKSEQKYKLGMSVSVAYNENQIGNISADTNVAAVILDAEGKIVDCRIDVVQSKVEIADGFLADGAAKLVFRSKYDLGDDYNMKKYGGAIGEWYEQADAFAGYCIGKTAEEVEAIAVNEQGKPTDADLTAGCTIAVSDYKAAVVKACKDEQAKEFTSNDVKLGLFVKANVDSAKDSENNDGSVKLLGSFAATAVDAEGLLAAAVIDATQPEFKYNDNGEVTSASYKGTKREQKENYGMVAYAGAVAEWYQQADTLCDWLIGLSAEEIKAVPDKSGKPVDADLAAACTIYITGDVNNIVTAMTRVK